MLRTVRKAIVSSGAAFSNAGAAQAQDASATGQHGEQGAARLHGSVPFSKMKLSAGQLSAERLLLQLISSTAFASGFRGGGRYR